MNKILPKINAMLLCDNIITEIGTKKKSLIGVFENIFSTQFPYKHYKLSVYVKFTSAQGKYKFKLELVDLSDNTIIGRGFTDELYIQNKLGFYELEFGLMGLIFRHEGTYDFRLFADDKIFANKTVRVIKSEPKNSTATEE